MHAFSFAFFRAKVKGHFFVFLVDCLHFKRKFVMHDIRKILFSHLADFVTLFFLVVANLNHSTAMTVLLFLGNVHKFMIHHLF